MKTIILHCRRSLGPQESSWFPFHYISKELEKRSHLLGKYSLDYRLTDDQGTSMPNKMWDNMDSLVTDYPNCFGPLTIAKVRNIPSFLEINYACPEIVNPFMKKDLERWGLTEKEISSETQPFGGEIYKLPAYIIGAGNQYTEKTYRDFGIQNVKMFRAGIDHENFLPNFEKRGDKIRFTFTAAVVNFRKGILHTLKAWRSLPESAHHKIELHIFGIIADGIIANEIKSAQKTFGNIELHGFMPNTEEEYRRVHATADCMLCPTLAEGQSGTALEGVSFGLYPIVSPYTGLDFENIPSSRLSADPEKWPTEIKIAIIHVIENYEEIKKTGPIIRSIALRDYTWENFSTSVIDFIEEVYKKHYGK